MPQLEKRQASVRVTPEMIEAGLSALTWYDPDRDIGREFVTEIYQAMAAVALVCNGRADHQDGRQPQKS